MKNHVLIIDDDKKLCDLLSRYLTQYDYTVSVCTHPTEGLKHLTQNTFDLLILDVMLPEMDGFATLKSLRKYSEIPVIMLTARGDTMDKIVGLELGADDYLPKPYEPRELLARIQSILRRTTGQQNQEKKPSETTSEIIQSGLLQVDVYKRVAHLAEQDLELTTLEFEILLLLIKNPSRVISRDEITDTIHGIDWNAYNRSIDVAVSRLRTKLSDDAKQPQYIKTIWGRGYQFIGTTQKMT